MVWTFRERTLSASVFKIFGYNLGGVRLCPRYRQWLIAHELGKAEEGFKVQSFVCTFNGDACGDLSESPWCIMSENFVEFFFSNSSRTFLPVSENDSTRFRIITDRSSLPSYSPLAIDIMISLCAPPSGDCVLDNRADDELEMRHIILLRWPQIIWPHYIYTDLGITSFQFYTHKNRSCLIPFGID